MCNFLYVSYFSKVLKTSSATAPSLYNGTACRWKSWDWPARPCAGAILWPLPPRAARIKRLPLLLPPAFTPPSVTPAAGAARFWGRAQGGRAGAPAFRAPAAPATALRPRPRDPAPHHVAGASGDQAPQGGEAPRPGPPGAMVGWGARGARGAEGARVCGGPSADSCGAAVRAGGPGAERPLRAPPSGAPGASSAGRGGRRLLGRRPSRPSAAAGGSPRNLGKGLACSLARLPRCSEAASLLLEPEKKRFGGGASQLVHPLVPALDRARARPRDSSWRGLH